VSRAFVAIAGALIAESAIAIARPLPPRPRRASGCL